MWLITPFGFFSIVAKPGDAKAGMLTIRARLRSDLERLRDGYLPGLGAITENTGTDYRFRAQAAKAEVASAMAAIASRIDYSNFKSEVAMKQGKARADVYGKVWNALYPLQDAPEANSPAEPAKSAAKPRGGKKVAYGGVLIDDRQRVLLRRPTGDFDGYVWTFPKGRPDPGETPEQAALREVREETGYGAQIIGKLPGCFDGGTTVTEFFVMSPLGKPVSLEAETSAIQWVTFPEAEKLIAMTKNIGGRKRDLTVLAAARDYCFADR